MDRAAGGCLPEKAQRPGPGEGRGSAMDAKLGVDMFEMLLHSRRSHHQLSGNLAIGKARGDQSQHFCFPLAQRLIEFHSSHRGGWKWSVLPACHGLAELRRDLLEIVPEEALAARINGELSLRVPGCVA